MIGTIITVMVTLTSDYLGAQYRHHQGAVQCCSDNYCRTELVCSEVPHLLPFFSCQHDYYLYWCSVHQVFRLSCTGKGWDVAIQCTDKGLWGWGVW